MKKFLIIILALLAFTTADMTAQRQKQKDQQKDRTRNRNKDKNKDKKKDKQKKHIRICPLCGCPSTDCWADQDRIKNGDVLPCGCETCQNKRK